MLGSRFNHLDRPARFDFENHGRKFFSTTLVALLSLVAWLVVTPCIIYSSLSPFLSFLSSFYILSHFITLISTFVVFILSLIIPVLLVHFVSFNFNHILLDSSFYWFFFFGKKYILYYYFIKRRLLDHFNC